jgi:hypothetical protein
MALTTTNIIPRKLAETAATVQYTATGVTTVIDKFTVTNTTASTVFINVYLPNSGSSPAASNLVINARTLGGRETYTCPRAYRSNFAPGSDDCDSGWDGKCADNQCVWHRNSVGD